MSVAGIEVHPEVAEALDRRRPVVALETALVTAGLPAEPLGRAPAFDAPGWDPAGPAHLETALLLRRLVRAGGAMPAAVGLLDGVLRIGLDDEALRRLAAAPSSSKVAAGDLAAAMAAGRSAGTTVSATLVACGAPRAGAIAVLSTGGIGGVHRGWTRRPDVSADLGQLATRRVCVVASGPKAVLDQPATLELLEALGVPVIVYGADTVPGFWSRGDGPEARWRVDEPAAAAAVCRAHWSGLGCGGGLLLANPVPESLALEAGPMAELAAGAEAEARRRGIRGPDRTPWLLRHLGARSGGRTVEANIGLLAANARLAAAVACALAGAAAPSTPHWNRPMAGE